jgi:hypothetical protein
MTKFESRDFANPGKVRSCIDADANVGALHDAMEPKHVGEPLVMVVQISRGMSPL